tara:strand:+ start:265 stop:510 length:246 start_codon:yes stop_codon:yes gene_type:complete
MSYSYHEDITETMWEVSKWLVDNPMFASYKRESLRWTGDQVLDEDGRMHKTSFKFEWHGTTQLARYNVQTKRMITIADCDA